MNRNNIYYDIQKEVSGQHTLIIVPKDQIQSKNQMRLLKRIEDVS